jgi:hypothetical protein
MEPRDQLIQLSHQLADAISRRDAETLQGLLAPGFLYRTVGGGAVDAATFLAAIRQIPGEILSVKVEGLAVDLRGDQALVTGFQEARVRVDGQEITDRKGFVDWFGRHSGQWRLQLALDFAV